MIDDENIPKYRKQRLVLTNKNILLYAIKNYENCQCTDIEEVYSDIKRLKYIKKLLKYYLTTGELKHRLIINHLVVFYNVFEISAATSMLFFKIDPEYHPALKTFLVFLEKLSEENSEYINIQLDKNIIKILRQI